MVQQPSVLLVCITTVIGGAEVRVMQTARALAAHGWRYTVAVLPESPLHKALAAEGLAAEPMGRSRADPRIVRGLLGAARKLQATCIDSHNMQSQYWASLAAGLMPSLRRIITVHSVYRECYPRAPKLQVHEGALRFGRMLGSEFVAVSDSVAADLKRIGVPGNRITVSKNGIESLPVPPEAAPDLETLGLDADDFVISIVGRLDPVKGHTYLLQAVAGLMRDGEKRIHVLVVGNGREGAALEAEAEALAVRDRVHFLGFRKDVPALLARTDLLCMPSLTEGLPYTALEAARQSVPLLLSEVGGPAQVFTEGETAAFVPPANPDALKNAIARLMADPAIRRRIGQGARDLVAKSYSVERMNKETLAIYASSSEQVGEELEVLETK